MRVNNRYVSFYSLPDDTIEKITIDAQKTALLIIDMQKIVLSRPDLTSATLQQKTEAARWEPFYQHIEKVVIPNNQKILKAFREKGMEVAFAKLQGQKRSGKDRSLLQKMPGYNETYLPPGDPLAAIVPELTPINDEIIVEKTCDSSLTGTSLRLWLFNMGIDTVICTGVLTDQCVSSTVRSLADESFKVWLIEDATAAATAELHKAELTILNNIYCHVINTEELLQALNDSTSTTSL